MNVFDEVNQHSAVVLKGVLESTEREGFCFESESKALFEHLTEKAEIVSVSFKELKNPKEQSFVVSDAEPRPKRRRLTTKKEETSILDAKAIQSLGSSSVKVVSMLQIGFL